MSAGLSTDARWRLPTRQRADAHEERPGAWRDAAKAAQREAKRRVTMSKLLERLNVLAICLLGGVLASALVAQVLPGVRPPAGSVAESEMYEREWAWPKTLQVYPSHPGDPVKLVRIMKDGKEIVPGTYRMPEIAGDDSHQVDAVKDWLKDASFTLRSQTSKNIVSVGIAVVFPVRNTDYDCVSDPGLGPGTHEPWCKLHPHWCDGGCPQLIDTTLHWGLIPGMTASGLETRYRAEATGHYGDRAPLQGAEWLRLQPGQEVTLSPAGREVGMMATRDPRHPFSENVNAILSHEGIEEAKGTEPCHHRFNSKTGCAFAEVSKFNIGLDIVYFEDGTIWGNYGYGYALPNADGIFTRVDARHFPGIVSPASAPN